MTSERAIQTKVGLFMLIGLAAAAILIVYFGRMGEGMRRYYNLNINYSNASGIKKGADVLLSGARVGRVARAPVILSDMQGVSVPVMLYDHVKVPKGSRFTIGSSGLLGDRFVDILVGKDVVKAPPILPGSTVQGERETGIADIISTVNRVAEQASDLMTHLDTTVQDVDQVAKTLHKDLLKSDSLKKLAATLENFKSTSENFSQASKQMSGVLTSAKAAADEIQKAASDVRSVAQTAQTGPGALATILKDPQTATNVRALIFNLRRHGILWYKNSAPMP